LYFGCQGFYPNIYKLLDCEANAAGKGLIRICRSDKVDIRDVINETKYKNLYLLSPSPSDPMEDYFDFQLDDVDRVITTLKETFDFVLIDIPNNPPLEFCISSVKNCNVGFLYGVNVLTALKIPADFWSLWDHWELVYRSL